MGTPLIYFETQSRNMDKYVDIDNRVYTIVITMSKYIATVIKTGNSYALRVPKSYIDEGQLNLGDKTTLPPAQKKQPQDQNRAEIQQAIRNLQKLNAFSSIKDPVAWQREIRKDRPLPGRE